MDSVQHSPNRIKTSQMVFTKKGKFTNNIKSIFEYSKKELWEKEFNCLTVSSHEGNIWKLW